MPAVWGDEHGVYTLASPGSVTWLITFMGPLWNVRLSGSCSLSGSEAACMCDCDYLSEEFVAGRKQPNLWVFVSLIYETTLWQALGTMGWQEVCKCLTLFTECVLIRVASQKKSALVGTSPSEVPHGRMYCL